MFDFITGLAVGGGIGIIAGIFIYRNNKVKLSKYADKVDELYDKLEDTVKENTSKEV